MFDRLYQVGFGLVGLLFLFAGGWLFSKFPNMGPEGFVVVAVMIAGVLLLHYAFNRPRS